MTFFPAPALPANAATIDADRRLIVGGKPYMPLGLYTQQVTRGISTDRGEPVQLHHAV